MILSELRLCDNVALGLFKFPLSAGMHSKFPPDRGLRRGRPDIQPCVRRSLRLNTFASKRFGFPLFVILDQRRASRFDPSTAFLLPSNEITDVFTIVGATASATWVPNRCVLPSNQDRTQRPAFFLRNSSNAALQKGSSFKTMFFAFLEICGCHGL